MLVLCESLLLPLLGTAGGAACVFFFGPAAQEGRSGRGRFFERVLIGFSAGVMTAASFFSLLLPAIGCPGGFFPALIGLVVGILSLSLIDFLLRCAAGGPASRAEGSRAALGFLAVLLHNIPEGMAVGAALAGYYAGGTGGGEVLALAVGITVQNLPDGAIVSLPYRAAGRGRGRAFLLGLLSGAVEPVFALLACFLSGAIAGLLPYLLSFAAGAMLYVVVRELVPEMESDGRTGMPAFTVGFILLMLLDRFFAG